MTQWGTYADLAAAWWRERDAAADDPTPAREFLYDATATPRAECVEIVQALVDAAPDEDALALVGAGPLEDLLSHDGHGARFVAEVEERARSDPRFAKAVAGLWLGDGVPADVRRRLARYGATDLTGEWFGPP